MRTATLFRTSGILALVILAALAAPAAAQPGIYRPATPLAQAEPRFYLGLDFLSSHIGADDPQPSSPVDAVYVDEVGAGAALHFGWMLTRTFQLRLYLSDARHEATDPDVDFRLDGGTVEALHLFRAGQPLRPYLVGGLGGFSMKADRGGYRYETTGPGAVFGAGLYYLVTRSFLLHFQVRAEFINWEESKAEVELPGGGTVRTVTPIAESGAAGKFTLGCGFRF